MIKIAICDDEKALRTQLREIAERELQLQGVDYNISEFESGESFLRANDSFDILFLDIEMPGINGIDTAKSLRQMDTNTIIIFVTSYKDFVFQGYEVRALNYILKPYKEEKIKEVLFVALTESAKLSEQYYLVEQRGGTTKLYFKDVICFSSDRRMVTATGTKNTVSFYGTLSDLEGKLPSFFVRIHSRHLVNLHYVEHIKSNSVICSSETLPVSRSCKPELMTAFAKFMVR